jgi:hypothetical protein
MTDLRLNLVLTVLRLGAGPFSFDPIAHLVGAPIAESRRTAACGRPGPWGLGEVGLEAA